MELIAANALGIAAASFASGVITEQAKIERSDNGASKDRAESPTACRNAQKDDKRLMANGKRGKRNVYRKTIPNSTFLIHN